MTLGFHFTLCLATMYLCTDSTVFKANDMEIDSFQIVHEGKSFTLSSNERIDASFLSQIFNVKQHDIIGLQLQNGLLVRLSNEKLSTLVNGKITALKVVERDADHVEINRDCSADIHPYSNIKGADIEIITFASKGDSGTKAMKDMVTWLHDANNQHISVLDIKSNYFGPHHYWWHVIYTK